MLMHKNYMKWNPMKVPAELKAFANKNIARNTLHVFENIVYFLFYFNILAYVLDNV